jgi:hypothetical protein
MSVYATGLCQTTRTRCQMWLLCRVPKVPTLLVYRGWNVPPKAMTFIPSPPTVLPIYHLKADLGSRVLDEGQVELLSWF